MKRFDQLIKQSAIESVSDVHIVAGHPLVRRINGRLHHDNTTIWTHQEIHDLLRELLESKDREIFGHRMSVDFAVTISNIRIRINVFNCMAGYGLAIRLLPGQAPTIEQLNLHPSLKDYCKVRDGLILICGATGSGKSGTIAAMIEEINRTTSSRIITLEDPVEYRFISKKSFISQRELGTHFPTFEQGLLDILREDADVIVVGELREPSVMRLALDAAESGHLVITTAHASTAEDALHRISNSFPAEAQTMVRNQLSSTLSLLIVQKLVLKEKLNFRVPVLSVLRATQPVKSIIRDDKLAQLQGTIQTSRAQGMYTMEQYEEYLAGRKDLVPPGIVFRSTHDLPPTPDKARTVHIKINPVLTREYSKPLSDRDVKKEKTMVNETSLNLTDDQGQQYIIEEETSMEEIIREMGHYND